MEHQLMEQLMDLSKNRFWGKYRGLVVDNADPTQRGRLKVQVPAVLDTLETWAMPCVPYAGAGVGFYSLPEPGSGVWVEFEGGDPSFAIWTGCFWGDGQLPDPAGAAVKIWKTESLTLRFDDDADEAKLENTAASRITLTADVLSESSGAKHSVGAAGVVSEKGPIKAEVGPSAFLVNNGALEVK